MEFIVNQFRTICFFIDNIVYTLIAKAYELIIYLSNIDLFNNNSVVEELVNRIYLLLGIFMLFKVSFSIIQYLIDPNAFSDKAKGFGKLLTNLLTAIVLLVTVPFIFQKAYELQNYIVSENILSNLILGQKFDSYSSGSDGQDKNNVKNISQMATDVQFTLFSAFYTLNTKEGDSSAVPECAPGHTDEATGYTNGATSNVFGSRDMAKSEPCLSAVEKAWENEQARKERGVKLTDFFKTATGEGDNIVIEDNRDFHAFDSLLWWRITPNQNYTINYLPFISTLTGGYVLLLLITFCIDIALRAIKLLFLQTIAPIAIISYIDPKESASQGKLHNWAMECLKTFLSLFLRLAVVFLAFRLVQMVTETLFYPQNGSIYMEGYEAPESMNMFVYVFLILGIFAFAKQVPKMIEEIFGIKMSGEMQLNPFKAIGNNAGATALLAGGAALGATGLAVGGKMVSKGQNVMDNIKKISKSEDLTGSQKAAGILRNVGSFGRLATAGAWETLKGTATGASKGLTSGGKGYLRKGLRQGGTAAWNMQEQEESNLVDRMRNRFQEETGAPSDYYGNKRGEEERERARKIIESMNDSSDKEAKARFKANPADVLANNYLSAQGNVERLKQAMQDGSATKQDLTLAEKAFKEQQTIFQNDMESKGQFVTELKDLTGLNTTFSEIDGFTGAAVKSIAAVKALDDRLKDATKVSQNSRPKVARDAIYSDHGQRATSNWREKQ